MNAYSITHGLTHLVLTRVFNWIVYFTVLDTVGYVYCRYYDIYPGWRMLARWTLVAQVFWLAFQGTSVYMDFICGLR
jgi:hypothetical protein